MSVRVPPFFRDLLALPPEASTMAKSVDGLHLFVISVTMIGSIAIALIAFIWLVKYPQRAPGQLTPKIEASATTELSLAGFTLALFLLFWVIGFYQFIDMREPPKGSMTIYVTAKQWMWKFEYPQGRSSNNVLVVPADRDVQLVMTSRDVIHSFYVPAFRVKQDVVPGRYIVTWFRSDMPGDYPIFCAELCGISHSMMLGEVQVLSPSDYENWLNGAPVGQEKEESLVAKGRDVALRYQCTGCHTDNGERHVGPTWSRLYDSYVLLSDGRRVKADEAYLTKSMMEPGADMVAGFQNVMPAAYRTMLTQPEVGALVEFIKSLQNGETPSAPMVPLPRLNFTDDAGVRDASPPPASTLVQ